MWLISGLAEIDARYAAGPQMHIGLLFVALSLAAGALASLPLRWRAWQNCVELMSVVPGLFLLTLIERELQPLSGLGLLTWPISFAAYGALLHWRERSDPARLPLLHAIGFWTLIALLTHAAQIAIEARLGQASAWWLSSLAAIPTVLAAVAFLPAANRSWPLSMHAPSYRGAWLLPVALWLSGWLLVSNLVRPGAYAPTPYLPVLNVQDLVNVGTLWLLVGWWAQVSARTPNRVTRAVGTGLGALAFLFLNAALLRALHVYLPVAWDFEVMLDSFSVQASLTLLWVTTALALMVTGSRRGTRWLWLVGAGLMGVVVLKLFAVDTAASGTLARIAAFFGVAIGLFVAGYFAPRPPSERNGSGGGMPG